MKIYLDNCCYNRPFDDQNQPRVREETKAIFSVINQSKINGDIILSSDVLLFEIGKIKNPGKRADVFSSFNKSVSEKVQISSAEFGNADIFLTTDDKLIKACQNLSLNVKVFNPVSYLAEVLKNDEH